jgi:1,4-alpha-glucan branching enzyme
VLGASYQFVRQKNNTDKVLVFEKDKILFVFNWHPSTSHVSYPVYCQSCSKAKVLWSTDDYDFGGHGRVYHETYAATKCDELTSTFKVFLPSRSAIVFELLVDKH